MYSDVLPNAAVAIGETSRVCTEIVLELDRYQPTSKLLQRSRGVRLLLAKYWAETLHNGNMIAQEGNAEEPRVWNEICSILIFLAIHTSDKHNLDEIFKRIGGAKPGLADLLVNQVALAIICLDGEYNGPVLKLHRVLDDEEVPFTEALLFHRVIKSLVTFLRGFAVYSRYFAQFVEERLLALTVFESESWVSSKACENMKCVKIDRKASFKAALGAPFLLKHARRVIWLMVINNGVGSSP
ncbi:hypothetical protein DFH09DRAFT_1462081 [Mycena vulgaris]|nr:hypothetical protein DFH09DRAFT_1462081 [Mycena vulgaris]